MGENESGRKIWNRKISRYSELGNKRKFKKKRQCGTDQWKTRTTIENSIFLTNSWKAIHSRKINVYLVNIVENARWFSIVSLHYDLSMYFLIFFFIPAWFYLKDKSKRWLWNWDFLSFRNGGLAMLPRGRIRKLFFWTSCMCIVREGQSLVGKEATYLYRLEFLFWVIVLLSYWLLCRDWPIRANLASRMNFHSANDAQFVNMRSADRWFSFLKWFNGHIVYKDRCRLMYPPCYCFPLLSEGLIVTRFIVKFISN